MGIEKDNIFQDAIKQKENKVRNDPEWIEEIRPIRRNRIKPKTSVQLDDLESIRKTKMELERAVQERSESFYEMRRNRRASSPPVKDDGIILPKIPSPFGGRLNYIPRSLKTRSGIFKLLATIFLSASFLAYCLYYRYETFKLGYCDGTQKKPDPSYLDFLRARCIPCPLNGICKDRKFIGCENGFTPKEHPLNSIMFPFPPVCIKDLALVQKMDEMYAKSIDILKRHSGNVRCGYIKGNEELSSTDLFNNLLKFKDKFTSIEDFNETYNLVLPRLLNSYDLLIRHSKDLNSDKITFLKAKAPILSPSCIIRLVLKNAFRNHLKEILFFTLVLSVFYYFYLQNKKYKSDTILAADLADRVLHLLIQRDHDSVRNPERYPDASLSITLLRDTLLSRSYPKLSTREALWEKVVHIIENNSNVRTYLRDHRGDDHKVWEWVGEDIPSSMAMGFKNIRKSGFDQSSKNLDVKFGIDEPLVEGDDEGATDE